MERLHLIGADETGEDKRYSDHTFCIPLGKKKKGGGHVSYSVTNDLSIVDCKRCLTKIKTQR